MTEDKMREAFEAWFRKTTPEVSLDRNMPDGSYNNMKAHYQWPAWQAQAQEIEALRADAWDRKDTARLDWLINELRERDMRRIGIDTLAGGIAWTRVAIDAAMHKAKK